MKKTLVLLIIICLILSFAGCGVNGTINRFSKKIVAGSYGDAIDIYLNDVRGNAKLEEECYQYLCSVLQEGLDSFIKNETTESNVKQVYKTIEAFNNSVKIVSKELNAAWSDLGTIADSKASFDKADSEMEQKMYLQAMYDYLDVSPVDTADYSVAQEKAEEAKNQYVGQIVEEATSKMDSKDYTGADTLIRTAEQQIGKLEALETMRIMIHTSMYEAAFDKALSDDNISEIAEIMDTVAKDQYFVYSQELEKRVTDTIQDYINVVAESAEATLQSSDSAAAEKAIAICKAAEDILGKCDAFELIYQKAYTQKYATDLAYYISANDIYNVIRIYNNATKDKNATVSMEMTAQYAEFLEFYRENALRESVAAYKTDGYVKAYSIVMDALNFYPEDDDLRRFADMYLTCAPVTMENATVERDDYAYISYVGSANDFYGNQYQQCAKLFNYYGSPSSQGSITLYLNEEYTTFRTSYFPNNNWGNDVTGWFRIYSGGTLLFDSGTICADDKVKPLTIDLTNVEEIKIELKGKSIYFVEPVFYRELSDRDFGKFAEPVKEKEKSTLKVELTKSPEKVTLGKGCTIAGTIESNYKITNVTAQILDADGKEATESVAIQPNCKSLDIKESALNKELKFSTIQKAGNYTLKIVAEDESGERKIYTQEFVVE